MRGVELNSGRVNGEMHRWLRSVGQQTRAAADRVVPREAGEGPAPPKDVAINAAQELLFQAAERAASRLAWAATTSGRAALGGGLGAVSAGLGGLGAGLSAVAALKWGFERIIEAHQRAHAQDIRWHLARGLAVTVALGLVEPDRGLAAIRQGAIRRARQDHDEVARLDHLRRGGESWPADRRRRHEAMAGWRAGMEAGLRLLAGLDPARRQTLRRAIGVEGVRVEQALQTAAAGAIAAGDR